MQLETTAVAIHRTMNESLESLRDDHPSPNSVRPFLVLFSLLACSCVPDTVPNPSCVSPESGEFTRALGDDDVAAIVQQLDFERYKAAIRCLAAFGDREIGTQSNIDAVDWVESQLRSFGYEDVQRLRAPSPRGDVESLFVTKVGSSRPDEMYIVSAHLDGRGGGGAADDNASGSAVVLELARVLASGSVDAQRTVRFILWNSEEFGMVGSGHYIESRDDIQGVETPLGSGQYPEPRWLGIIQHDMVLFDHGLPPTDSQSPSADLDIEYDGRSDMAQASADLAAALVAANEAYADIYPAAVGSNMALTDSVRFANLTAAVSVRENERMSEIAARSNPHYHRATDEYESYSDADFRLGFSAAQTTLGAIGWLAGLSLE